MKLDFQDNTANTAWRNALRRGMLARRAEISPAQHAAWSARIVEHLLATLAQGQGRVLGFCWPIRQEADILPALAPLQAAGWRTALAVVIAENAPLAFREWDETTPMAPDRYGIPTPTAGAWLQADILLLPVNAFDTEGYRLGYGGGYFDRTLASLDPKPRAIGIGFELNQVESIRPQTHDQRLDSIVTETGKTDF